MVNKKPPTTFEFDPKTIGADLAIHANRFHIEKMPGMALLHFVLVDQGGSQRSVLQLSMDMQDLQRAANDTRSFLSETPEPGADEIDHEISSRPGTTAQEDGPCAVRALQVVRSNEYAELVFAHFSVWALSQLGKVGRAKAPIPLGRVYVVQCASAMQRQFLAAIYTAYGKHESGGD